MVGNVMTFNLKDENTIKLPGSNQLVSYTDESVLSIHRNSTDTDLESVVLKYTEDGKEITIPALRDSKANNNFTLYVPTDVATGDLVFTTATEGSLVYATVDTSLTPSYEYDKYTIKGVDVPNTDAAYASVRATNGLADRAFNVDIIHVDLGMRTVKAIAHNVAPAESFNTSDAKHYTVTTDPDGTPVYTAYVPNADETMQAAIDAYAYLQAYVSTGTMNINGVGLANKTETVTVTPELTAGLASGSLRPFDTGLTAPTDWSSSEPSIDKDIWLTAMAKGETTRMKMKVNVVIPNLTHTWDEASHTYSIATDLAPLFVREYYLDIHKTNGDASLKNDWVLMDYSEPKVVNADPENEDHFLFHEKIPVVFLDASGKPTDEASKNVPETTTEFTLHVAANSDSAKVDVRVYDPDFDYDDTTKVDFTTLSDTADVTFDFKDYPEADGSIPDSLVIAITIQANAGNRQTYFLTVNRVIKTMGTVKAGTKTEYLTYVANHPADMTQSANITAAANGALHDAVAVEYWDMEIVGNQLRKAIATSNPANIVKYKVYIALADPAASTYAVYGKPLFPEAKLDVTELGTAPAAFGYVKTGMIDDTSITLDGDLLARLTVKGAEDDSVAEQLKYNTEYVHMVDWNNNVDLEKVEATFTVAGFDGAQGDSYTIQAVKEIKTGDTEPTYVLYVPAGMGIDKLDNVTATTVDKYAKVRVNLSNPYSVADDARVYGIHTDEREDVAVVTDNTYPTDVTNLYAHVKATENYYQGAEKTWNIEVRPVDLSLTQVWVDSVDVKEAQRVIVDDNGTPGNPSDDVLDRLRFEVTIQPFGTDPATNVAIPEYVLAKPTVDTHIKVKVGYLPIPTAADKLAVYEGKYSNYVSSDKDIKWLGSYDQTMSNWDNTNQRYTSDDVDLHDIVEANTMVKIRVEYWVDTNKDGKPDTLATYVDYNLNVKRQNNSAKDLALALGQSKAEDAEAPYAIAPITPTKTDVDEDGNNTLTYYYGINQYLQDATGALVKKADGGYELNNSDSNPRRTNRWAYLTLEQLGIGTMTDLSMKVEWVKRDGTVEPGKIGDQKDASGPVNTNHLPLTITSPEEFLSGEDLSSTSQGVFTQPFAIGLGAKDDGVGNGYAYTKLTITSKAQSGLSNTYVVIIYDLQSNVSLDTDLTRIGSALRKSAAGWDSSSTDLNDYSKLAKFNYTVQRRNVITLPAYPNQRFVKVKLVATEDNLVHLRNASIQLMGTSDHEADYDLLKTGNTTELRHIIDSDGNNLTDGRIYTGWTAGAQDGAEDYTQTNAGIEMYVALNDNDVGYLYFTITSADGTETRWYCLRVTVQASTGDVRRITLSSNKTSTSNNAVLAVDENGNELFFPAYGDATEKQFAANLADKNVVLADGQTRAQHEAYIMDKLVSDAERAEFSEAPDVVVYRGFVTRETADEEVAVNVEIEATQQHSIVQVLGKKTSNSDRALINEDTVTNVTSGYYKNGVLRKNLARMDGVTLKNLQNTTNPPYDPNDVNMTGWPVEYLYFKVTTEQTVRYYVLEIYVQDDTDSNRALGYDYWERKDYNLTQEDPTEGFTVWAYGANEGNYTNLMPNAQVAYLKDSASDFYRYATDFKASISGGFDGHTLTVEDISAYTGTTNKDYAYVHGAGANKTYLRIRQDANGKYHYYKLDSSFNEVELDVVPSTTGKGAYQVQDDTTIYMPADRYGMPLRVYSRGVQKDENGDAILDAKGRYLPIYLTADVDPEATRLEITAETEYPYSGIMMNRNSSTNGNYVIGKTSMTVATPDFTPGNAFDVYIHVLTQRDQPYGTQYNMQKDHALTYILNVMPGLNNRNLKQVDLLTSDGSGLVKTVVSQNVTATDVYVDVPYGMDIANMAFIPSDERAVLWINAIGDSALWDDGQTVYSSEQNLLDGVDGNDTVRNVAYASLPVDPAPGETLYRVYVGNKVNDSGANYYNIHIRRRDNDLSLYRLDYNGRQTIKTGLTAALTMNANGDLVVDTATLAGTYTLTNYSPVVLYGANSTYSNYGIQVDSNTGKMYIYDKDNIAVDSNHYRSEITNAANIPVYSIDIPLDDTKLGRLAAAAVQRNTIDGRDTQVDVHALVSKGLNGYDAHDESDPSDGISVYRLNRDTSMIVPVFLTSADTYDFQVEDPVGSGTMKRVQGLSDDTNLVLLVITRKDDIADLDVRILVNHQANHPETLREATTPDAPKDLDTLPNWTPWPGDAIDGVEKTYHVREAVIYSDATHAYVTVTTGSRTSMITIYEPDGTILVKDQPAIATVTHEMKQADEDNILYVVVTTPDGNERIYRLHLLRNSGNTDLEIVRAMDHMDTSNPGKPLGAAPVDGKMINETTYTIQLPMGTGQTYSFFQTVDKNATLRVRELNRDGKEWSEWSYSKVWRYDPENDPDGVWYYNEKLDEDVKQGTINVFNRPVTTLEVEVTAPNGNQKVYTILIYNVPSDATLEIVEVGYASKADKTLKTATITGPRSWAAGIAIADSDDLAVSEAGDYMIVPFRMVASDPSARLEIRDKEGQNYLNYLYTSTDDIHYKIVTDDKGLPIPVEDDVVMYSSIKKNHFIRGELVINKETYTSFTLIVSVIAASGHVQDYEVVISCNRNNLDEIIVEIYDIKMMLASDGRFHYVEEYTGGIGDVEEGDILYYASKGIVTKEEGSDKETVVEYANRLYRLYQGSSDFATKFTSHAIYREVVFPASVQQVELSAYYTDLEKRLNNNQVMNITIGVDPYDESTIKQYGTGYDSNDLSTIYADGIVGHSIKKTTNGHVPLSGAETVVPIKVDVGSDTATYYAVVRKDALDQYLDYIKVEGERLSLNRDAATNELVARTTVYNTTRTALIEIGANDPNALIELKRKEFYVYTWDSVNEVWVKDNNLTLGWDYGSDYGYMAVTAKSLNDGDNVFKIVATPSNPSMGSNEYTLIIRYVNVDVYLDRRGYGTLDGGTLPAGQNGLTIYDGTDPDTVSASDMRTLTPTYDRTVLDYTFTMEPTNSGSVVIDARAWQTYNELQATQKAYHEKLLTDERYTFYYEQKYNEQLGAIDQGIITEEQAQALAKQFADGKLADLTIAGEVAALIDAEMEKEAVVVWTGDASDPVQVLNAIMDYEARPDGDPKKVPELHTVVPLTGDDYTIIPINLTVPYTGFTRTYEVMYHNLQDNTDLVDFGVIGMLPNTVVNDADGKPVRKTYTVGYNTSEVDVFAVVEHFHPGATTQMVLYRATGATRELLATKANDSDTIVQNVELAVGTNVFEFVVTSETGTEKTYTVFVDRGLATLSLDWIRVDGLPATKIGDKLYEAYVNVDSDNEDITLDDLDLLTHVVQAKPKDSQAQVRIAADMESGVHTNVTKVDPKVPSSATVDANGYFAQGVTAVLEPVYTGTDKSVTATYADDHYYVDLMGDRVAYDAATLQWYKADALGAADLTRPADVTSQEADPTKNNDLTLVVPVIINVKLIAVTKSRFEGSLSMDPGEHDMGETTTNMENGPTIVTKKVYYVAENYYEVTTTVTSNEEYTRLIKPVNREALNVFVDAGNGLFDDEHAGKTYRQAIWKADEPRTDGSGTGAFVVGVPNTSYRSMVRTLTTVPQGRNEDAQMIQYSGSLAQGHDFDAARRYTTKNWRDLTDDVLNTVDSTFYTNVDITVGYDPFDANPQTKYELHIYKYSDQAFLTELYATDKAGNSLTAEPVFDNSYVAGSLVDKNPGQNEFFYVVDWNETEVNFPRVTGVEDSEVFVTISYPAGTNYSIGNSGNVLNVPLSGTYTTVKFRVVSQDGLHEREYSIIIIRQMGENIAKLKDIQLITSADTSDAFYYDFAPVFHPDPDVGIYYFAMDAENSEPLTIRPVVYDPASEYTVTLNVFEVQSTGGSPVTNRVGTVDIPNEYTLNTSAANNMAPGNTYHVIVHVERTGDYTASDYHLYLYKNITTEMDTITGGEPAIRNIRVDKQDVTRVSEKNIFDQNYYYTTSAPQANISTSALVFSGYQLNLIHIDPTAPTDPGTDGEPVRTDVTSTQNNIPVNLSNSDHNRYVLELTNGKERQYSSVTIYSQNDMAKLTNIKGDEQMVPLFDQDLFEYFVYVPGDRDTARLLVRAKTDTVINGSNGSGIAVENIRVRDVGGRNLNEIPGGNGGWTEFELIDGVNRVTITATAKFRGVEDIPVGNSSIQVPVIHNYRYAYEVELNRGDYPVTDADKPEKLHNVDTADIVEMDYDRGGMLSPIWNSQLLNYTLDYTGNHSVLTMTPTMRTLAVDETNMLSAITGGNMFVSVNTGKAMPVIQTNNGVTENVLATGKDTERPRGIFRVEVVQVNLDGTRTELVGAASNGTVVGGRHDGKGEYFHSGDKVVLTFPNSATTVAGARFEVTYITEVIGVDVYTGMDGKKTYEPHTTTKRYMVNIGLAKAGETKLPAMNDNIGIKVFEYTNTPTLQYPLTPSFTRDYDAYYTRVAHDVDKVKMLVDATYEVPDINGKNPGEAGYIPTYDLYKITINNVPAVSGQFFPIEDLVVGDNEYIVRLTDKDNNVKTYTVIINRADIETKDEDYVEPFLVDLKLYKDDASHDELDLIPVFDRGVHFYNVVVPYQVDQVDLYALSENADVLGINNLFFTELKTGVTAKQIEGTRKLKLAVGHENFYEIIAYQTDENGYLTGTKIRYIVNIVRLKEGYVPVGLDYLGVSEGTMSPVFDRRLQNYYVTVPYDVDNLDITALGIPGQSELVLTGSGFATPQVANVVKNVNLNVGRNEFRVYVYDIRTSGDPFYQGVYSLIIDRVTKEGMSLDLKALSATGDKSGDLEFTTAGRLDRADGFVSREMNYYVKVEDDETSVTLKPVALAQNAVITVNGAPLNASGEITVNLSSDTDTVVEITVSDSTQPALAQRYSVTFLREHGNNVITSIEAEMNGKKIYGYSGSIGFWNKDWDTTYQMDMSGDKMVTFTIKALYRGPNYYPAHDDLPEVSWETMVTVNGHRAERVGEPEELPGGMKLATYKVTVPEVPVDDRTLDSFEERFDIRAWVPAARKSDGSFTNANDFDAIQEFVLYAYDLGVDSSDKLMPGRLGEVENDTYDMAKRDENGEPITKAAEQYVNGAVTGPMLHQLGILEERTNDSSGVKQLIDTGTITTKFAPNVFHYEATVTGEKFYLSADLLTSAEHTAVEQAAFDVYKASAEYTQNMEKYLSDTFVEFITDPSVGTPVTIATATPTQLAAAKDYANKKFSYIYEPTAYIEVYDDNGYRRTVTSSGNYLEFEFDVVDPVYGIVADTKNLLIRVTQFAESGHEVISEYTVTVYHTPDPILRDLQTRQVNNALAPTYHPVTREYTTTVFDQEKNFNVWALADYGINYRGFLADDSLEGAKLTINAYKTRTIVTDPGTGEVLSDTFSDPLKITRAYQSKAEMEYDATTKLQLANEVIASAAGATTVSTNRDVLDVVYDQTDAQFGVKNTPTYVEKFWIEVLVEYTITVNGVTENRKGTYIIEVTRDDKPVPSGLDDLRAYQRKLDQTQTPAVDDFNQLLPMYRLTAKDDRNTILTDGVAGTTTTIEVLDPDKSTYNAATGINKVKVEYEGTAITGFGKDYPYYMVIMDYTDSRLWPVIEFDTTKVSNVKMEVTTQIGVKQPDGTFVMQDVATCEQCDHQREVSHGLRRAVLRQRVLPGSHPLHCFRCGWQHSRLLPAGCPGRPCR